MKHRYGSMPTAGDTWPHERAWRQAKRVSQHRERQLLIGTSLVGGMLAGALAGAYLVRQFDATQPSTAAVAAYAPPAPTMPPPDVPLDVPLLDQPATF